MFTVILITMFEHLHCAFYIQRDVQAGALVCNQGNMALQRIYTQNVKAGQIHKHLSWTYHTDEKGMYLKVGKL